jgi:hypothetical protein
VLMQIRTGNVYNQKHRWGWCPDDRCQLCGMADSATHILSACQHKPIIGLGQVGKAWDGWD